jgi:BatD DUF11 like domain
MMTSTRKLSPSGARYAPALAAAIFGIFIMCSAAPSWASLRAQFDRQTMQQGHTVTLTIESNQAQSQARPDLTPLRKDFDVLNTSTSSETSIINGTRSDSTSWMIQLQPLHAGTINVPPITVGNEQTAPLVLNVTPPSPQAARQTSAHVFIEVDAAPTGKSVYVQQQIPYTLRLYYDDTVQSGNLAAPDPANAMVEQLGKEQRYTTMRNEREYHVIERHYAISPEKSGPLDIPPASFRGSMLVAANSQSNGVSNNPIARLLNGTPFANDPFFKNAFGAGISFGATEQPVDIYSRDVALNVQPLPPGVHGNWLPAEQVTLHDSWDANPPRFKVGEPVTRTITIDVKGLSASQIPPLSFAKPANAHIYPEAGSNHSRTDGNVIYGISKQSVTYIPTAPGTLDIPPIALTWWNTDSNTQSRVALPAREFKVAPGAAGAQSNTAPAPPAAPASAAPRAKPAAAATPSSTAKRAAGASLTERLLRPRAWFAAGAALLALAALFAVAMRLRERRPESQPGPAKMLPVAVPRRKSIMQALQQACAGNDKQAAAEALLELARAEWPDDPPRGLGALAARLEAGGKEIGALDRSLYGSGALPWEGGALWNTVRNGLQAKRGEKLPKDDGLGALYP